MVTAVSKLINPRILGKLISSGHAYSVATYPLDVLFSVLRISTKYLMDDLRTWSLEHIELIYPTSSEELYASTNFAAWRVKSAAIDLIAHAHQFDAPKFLPYAYWAVATADWASRSSLQEAGVARLSQDELLRIGMARTSVQRLFTEMLIPGGTASPPLVYLREASTCSGGTCTSTNLTWAQNEPPIKAWSLRADMIGFLKFWETALPAWVWCTGCKESWRKQMKAKIREIFEEFCAVMELNRHSAA